MSIKKLTTLRLVISMLVILACIIIWQMNLHGKVTPLLPPLAPPIKVLPSESKSVQEGVKKENEEKLVQQKDSEIVGSSQWLSWFTQLPPEAQARILSDIEKTLYPAEPNQKDWKTVKVSPGPGASDNDLFPCKVLTNYKPLLQVRSGIGVVGLQFEVLRNEGSILTSIWSRNAKKAIVVDWTNGQVIPAQIDTLKEGVGLSPQYVPPGMNILGGLGELAFGDDKSNGGVFEWKKNYISHPLALALNEQIGFGTVYQDKPRALDAIICVSFNPAKILGEVKMPESKTVVWCIYDIKQSLLLIAEHEWNWMAMIDFANSTAIQKQPEVKSVPGTDGGK